MPTMISAPPEYVINYALMMAMMSPCAKSKRGVEHPAQWHRYAPEEFHRETLRRNGIG